ncbi:MAG: MFS transporter [Pseudomonadota bacterium]|jgi:ACS family tartrate transporter-like MFS transporter|nr:MAG: MFS transporter [Pseudomonadota bacterium]
MGATTSLPADVGERLYGRTLRRLLLPIALLTFINSIDRMNVSFAGQPMSADTGMSATVFGLGVSTFFAAYLIFQYPHALLLRRMGIRPWLLLSMSVWGIAGILMSRVEDATDFMVARFLLGTAEAGFAPGMTWYISQWTPRATRARAMAVALAAVPFSLVVGGPLCGWLLGMGNPLELAGWRWMFLVSAIPNFLFAVAAAFYFVDRPRQARWLSEEEGRQLEAQVDAERDQSAPARLSWGEAMADTRIWLCCAVWFLVMTGSYALVYWLPQIVRQLALARSELLIGTLSALPQAGVVAGLFLNARHSDRSGERLRHSAAGALLAGIALAVAVFLPEGTAVLALLVVAGFGFGATQGVFWTVPQALGIGGGHVPVGVIAAISMAGTAGGIVGPAMLGWLLDLSGSHLAGILVLAGFLLAASAALWLWRAPRRVEVGHAA